ncbi:MAG: hypothetical protein KDC38_09740 [Planctomycetes bacterium]|nr:hypothetical protein [Planctomycetota bacterium]
MLLHPRTQLWVGSTLVFFLCWKLALTAPMPATLSATHAAIGELTSPDGCITCHHPSGLAFGCLSCHEEIQAQLTAGRGYHARLMEATDPTCGGCHSEHLGEGFSLTNEISWGAQVPAAFRHTHVDFGLDEAHLELRCEACHFEKREEPFRLTAYPDQVRERTFLGLTQTCGACHEDPHAGGWVEECGACHGQRDFDPPVYFDHSTHFPLEGGHDGLTCEQCHRIPGGAPEPGRPLPFPFDDARGDQCGDCHRDPHRVDFAESCDRCHDVAKGHWSARDAMTAERHARSGFPLVGPHASVACEGCHVPDQPFSVRHPDPRDPSYRRAEDTCDGCHADVHRGQFADRYDACLDCHQKLRFVPSTFGQVDHAESFELLGAHLGVACTSCHERDADGARRFVGLGHDCRGCHDDPHAGQFAEEIAAGDCISCHRPESDTFAIRPFDHVARTGVELVGAHARAECVSCHARRSFPAPDGSGEIVARRFVGTPRECRSCHTDVHLGQFDEYAGCDACHVSQESWEDVEFDHDAQSRFKLEGAHRAVLCTGCHRPVPLENGREFVRYKPLDFECGSCHEIDTPR